MREGVFGVVWGRVVVEGGGGERGERGEGGGGGGGGGGIPAN